MSLTTVTVHPSNIGFLRFVFPGLPIYSDTLPAFSTDAVIVSEERLGDLGDKRIVQVKRVAPVKLDSRPGFLAYLETNGVRILKSTRASLEHLSDEEFWVRAKLAHVLGSWPKADGRGEGSLFPLFEALFAGFKVAYRAYRNSGASHRAAFSALLTMMTRSLHPEKVKPRYGRILRANQMHVPRFRRVALEYLEGPQREMDFLGFLWALNEGGRRA